MLPAGSRSARAALMSEALPSVTRMNAGREPSWSRPTCSFTAPFVRLNFAQGNIERQRSTVVESRESSLCLNRKPCLGALPRQRRSSRPNWWMRVPWWSWVWLPFGSRFHDFKQPFDLADDRQCRLGL